MKAPVLAKLFTLLALLWAGSAQAQRYVCMESNQGNWCVKLLWQGAPNTVANFLRYVNAGEYTTTMVHRNVPGFVIQGGGYKLSAAALMTQVTRFDAIRNEYFYPNLRGTVAMAKQAGNADSATSQWFVNLVDNAVLDSADNNGGYTVFGQIVQGMDTVDKIAALRVSNVNSPFGTLTDVPTTRPSGSTSAVAQSDFVVVTRAYTTNLLPGTTAAPYHCSTPLAYESLTELCDGTVSFPLSLKGQGLYEVTLKQVASTGALKLEIVAGSLKRLSAVPDLFATYDQSTGLMTVPSVRVNQTQYVNVTLKLTDQPNQQFTLVSATPQ